MQTFETLMLRLTTNVTVSPASSARSSSAAWRMSSIASGRASANSAVSSSGSRRAPARAPPPPPAPPPRARAPQAGPQRARGLGPPRAAAGDERPVLRLDDVEHALVDPPGVDVRRIDAEALGQRDPVLGQALAHLVGRGGPGLGRGLVA